MSDKTREQWLNEAVDQLRPRFAGKKDVPQVRVSIGFPPKGGLARRKKVLGVCCPASMALDRLPQIYINPIISDVCGEQGILAVLTHELIHACGVNGHGKEFREVGLYVGLEGNMSSSVAGENLQEWFSHVIDKLGPCPHSSLHTGVPVMKPDKCRMHKCACPKCGYTVRIASKWITKGIPSCPVCKVEMERD